MYFCFFIISRWLYSLSLSLSLYFLSFCPEMFYLLLYSSSSSKSRTMKRQYWTLLVQCLVFFCVSAVTPTYIKNSLWPSDFFVDFCIACLRLFDSLYVFTPNRWPSSISLLSLLFWIPSIECSFLSFFSFWSLFVWFQLSTFSWPFFFVAAFELRREEAEGKGKENRKNFLCKKRIEHEYHLRFQIETEVAASQIEWCRRQISSNFAPRGTMNCSSRIRLLVWRLNVWSEKVWSSVRVPDWESMALFTIHLYL